MIFDILAELHDLADLYTSFTITLAYECCFFSQFQYVPIDGAFIELQLVDWGKTIKLSIYTCVSTISRPNAKVSNLILFNVPIPG